MKRYFAAFLGSIALASGAVLMGTQGLASNETSSSVAAGTQTVKSSSKSMYYKSQADADAALAAFGKVDPTCTAWSDWQKTCSRIGPEGTELHCNDSKVITKRSPIFCLSRMSYGKQFDEAGKPVETEQQYKATKKGAKRYCESYAPQSKYTDNFKKKRSGQCFKYNKERPFSGHEISEVRHPYCETWQHTGKDYCTEREGDTTLPSCKSMEGIRTKYPLTCSTQNQKKMDEVGCLTILDPTLEKMKLMDGPLVGSGPFNFSIIQQFITCGDWKE